MTIAKCTNTAASSNDSNHNSSTHAALFASGTACHRRRIGNSGIWTFGEAVRSLMASINKEGNTISRRMTWSGSPLRLRDETSVR